MKKDTTGKRVQVTLPLELYQALERQAREEVRTVPGQIRQILKRAWSIPKKRTVPPHLNKKARTWIGPGLAF